MKLRAPREITPLPLRDTKEVSASLPLRAKRKLVLSRSITQ
jgi:hypothetical protein